MQLKYCQKLDTEADPINKIKNLIIFFFRVQNQLSFII